jgi:hypothetical protein
MKAYRAKLQTPRHTLKSSITISKNWLGGPLAAFLSLVLALSCTTARAETLFDNGPGDPGTSGAQGFFADTSNPQYAAGDVFTPSASGTANSITFAGFYFNGGTPTTQPADDFTIYLYSVTAGTPDAPGTLINQATLTDETSSVFSTSSDGFPIYQFSGNLTTTTPFALSTGTEYYIGISNTTNPSVEFTLDVTPGYVGPATNGWVLVTDTAPGDPDNTVPDVPFSFSLSTDVVPEPSTWALLLGGLGLLACWRMRTRRA